MYMKYTAFGTYTHAMHLQSAFGEKRFGAQVSCGSRAISRELVSGDVFEVETGQSRKRRHRFHGPHEVAKQVRRIQDHHLSKLRPVRGSGARRGDRICVAPVGDCMQRD